MHQPTVASRYIAREIVFGLQNTISKSQPHIVEVVEGVPNPRNHRLLVRTGGAKPRYRGLACYEWIGATKEGA